ncbi:hypothetical protein AMTR_s00037p00233800 [Amborella trichopoda]|uniref:Uncharacterized protein n=1 Tax=Amborella trichopoda TaxID=13333 RepID=U5D4R7_AMBTC|nr:hypothetical protein AMTR_s00037p00233800 [Amborella trichopoda]
MRSLCLEIADRVSEEAYCLCETHVKLHLRVFVAANLDGELDEEAFPHEVFGLNEGPSYIFEGRFKEKKDDMEFLRVLEASSWEDCPLRLAVRLAVKSLVRVVYQGERRGSLHYLHVQDQWSMVVRGYSLVVTGIIKYEFYIQDLASSHRP